jgi:hypothetical protein
MTKQEQRYESIFDEQWAEDWTDERMVEQQKGGLMLYGVVLFMVVFGLAVLKALY